MPDQLHLDGLSESGKTPGKPIEIVAALSANNAKAVFLADRNPIAFNEMRRDITCRSQCGFPRSKDSKEKITGIEDSHHDNQPR